MWQRESLLVCYSHQHRKVGTSVDVVAPMAFVCTLSDHSETALVLKRGNGWMVTTPVGHCSEEDKSYYLFVTLDPIPSGYMELAFCLIEHNGEFGTEYLYWSGREVAIFVNKTERSKILACLLSIVHHLIETAKSDQVFMCTADADAPPKALRKYMLIVKVLEECGYRPSRYDPYHGKDAWLFVKAEQK